MTQSSTAPSKPLRHALSQVASRKKLVVVLGMHRSGTSVITRGLQALGVDLGESLMPPAAGNNEKGFFEDTEIVALNDRVLARAGRVWHSVDPIDADFLEGPDCFSLRSEAMTLLNSRLRDRQVFGLKDPRLCLVMPFWKCVFEDLDVDIAFVIALRNPLAAAQSLKERDGLLLEQSVALWGLHMLGAVRATAGQDRIFVSFDAILDEPLMQLNRVAETLNLPPLQEESPSLLEFQNSFLEQGLRRQRVGERELCRSGRATSAVTDLYNRLVRQTLLPDAETLENTATNVDDILARFDDIGPLLRAIDALEARASEAAGEAAQFEAMSKEVHRNLQIVQKAHDEACVQRDRAFEAAADLAQRHNQLEVAGLAERIHLAEQLGIVQSAHDEACRQRDHAIEAFAELTARHDQLEVAAAAERAHLAEQIGIVQSAHDEACRQRDRALEDFAELTLRHNQLEQSSTADLHRLTFQRDDLAADLSISEARRRADTARFDADIGSVLAALNGAAVSQSRLQARLSSELANSEHLRTELARTQSEVSALRASSSWKISAPFRVVSRLVRGEIGQGGQTSRQFAPISLDSKIWSAAAGLEKSRPFGPIPAISSLTDQPKSELARRDPWLAVIVHCFYPELLPELIAPLSSAECEIRLFVTSPPDLAEQTREILAGSGLQFVLIETENRGRDMAPFLVALKAAIAQGAGVILKLHTKRSPQLPNGDLWRRELVNDLIAPGIPGKMLATFNLDRGVGMVSPSGHVLSVQQFLGSNGPRVQQLMSELNISAETLKSSGFAAGSMFYARASCLSPLLDLDLSDVDFESETGQRDGTLAHALERILGCLVAEQGLRITATDDPVVAIAPLQLGTYRFV